MRVGGSYFPVLLKYHKHSGFTQATFILLWFWPQVQNQCHWVKTEVSEGLLLPETRGRGGISSLPFQFLAPHALLGLWLPFV